MATPILDRERPIPERKPPPAAARWLMRTVWIPAVFLYLAAQGPWLPTLRVWSEVLYLDWFRSVLDGRGALAVFATMAAAYYTAVAINVLATVIVGELAGFAFQWMRIGPLVIRRGLRIAIARGTLLSGYAEMTPDSVDHFPRREVALVLSGPLASLAVALALVMMPGTRSLYAGYVLMFSLAYGLAPLVPADTPGGASAGRRAAQQWGSTPHGKRYVAIVQLRHELKRGVLPERVDERLFRDATAFRDPSGETVMAHLYAFERARRLGRHDEAGEYLDVALGHSAHVGPEMREALKGEAAVYQARHRKRADLAEQWLADLPEKTIRPWTRPRVETAILAARGDVAGALARLADVEREMSALPQGGIRDLVMEEIRDWRAELEAAVA